MPETIPASPQPQISGEKKGPSNQEASEYAKRFLTKPEAAPEPKAADPIAPEATPEAQTPPAAEEAQSSPAEPEGQEPAETKVEPETKPEGDEALSHETSLDPRIQEKINRRIGKEVAKRKALEAEINTLKAQMMDQQAQPPPQPEPVVPLPANAPPLADVPDMYRLQQRHSEAKEALRWAEEQLDREDIGNGLQVGNQLLSKSDLKAIARNARITIEDHIPQRAQFLTQKQQAQQRAYEQYPFLKDKSSPEYLQAQTAYREYPWLKNLPNADEIIGRQIMGARYEAMLAAEAEKAKAKKAAKPPPARISTEHTAVSGDNGGPERVPPETQAKKQFAAVQQEVHSKRGVTARDYAALLAQKEKLKSR